MSTHDDPFAIPDSERTVILPTPGRRAGTPGRPAAVTQPSTGANGLDAAPASGINPLVAAANPLLNLVPRLRSAVHMSDIDGLREQLVRMIQQFERQAREAGVAAEKVLATRYVLCTLLDETVASTPWASGVWAKQSLLVRFHNETWGGEKVFQLLARTAEKPGVNLDFLELMYACLALGFEGRYRVIDNGRAQLEQLRERLVQLIRRERGEYERELSPRWQGTSVKRRGLLAVLPIWVVAAVCGALALAVFLTMAYLLNRHSDPVFAQISTLRVKTAGAPAPAPAAAPAPTAPATRTAPAPAAAPRLAGLLQPEVRQQLVGLREDDTRSMITIRGDGLFAPASAAVTPSYEPLIARIAQALSAVPGRVLVTGHTDSQPITSARFPSNWHLSQERARSVVQLLQANGVASTRLSAEGKADTEPIAPNNTSAGRSQNRRVEITLIPQRASAPARTP